MDSIENLFEPFYRVPSSPAGGTGIGLAITKGIVEAHGGAVCVENRPSGGAKFVIALPVELQPKLPREGADE